MLEVDITESAQQYLAELLAKQNTPGISVRMFVNDPGTSRAETCIAYCRPGEEKEGDEFVEMELFRCYFDGRSIPYLKDATVDYSPDRMGGQLTIKAPNAKMPQVSDDSPLADKVNYVLYNEVNPQLASHSGEVSLERMEGNVAVLKFGGGCQGCASVDLTLKEGVERTLMEKVPGLEAVRDVTDHTDRSQSYY
ncbi:MAG TPA: Fe-S biogenesis protein NfuA [Pseudomonadales bacterium]|nr:Fe-S biogenesis protein NfuA [Pseudomonadales bacterium]